VLLYGHLDKQPEMTGWAEGHGPWTPVMAGDKLYGRGGADDGYAIFASLAAILALAEQGVPHARAVILIEACEESGSYDLPFYVDHLAARIGNPSLVVCLDSGCANYDQLWLTTSLRGMVALTLTVRVLTEGVHSGDASGIVPPAPGSCACWSRGWRMRRPASSAPRTSMSRCRPSASPRQKSQPRRWGRRSMPNSPSRRHDAR
jgi:Acetylornithine deacetylase/Succinyl-diaminopimelate desuccinylase and related deacylases